MTDTEAPDRMEVVDDEMAAVLAAKTGAERLAIAAGMFRSARNMLEHHLREEHPSWPEDRVEREILRRLGHGAG